MTLKELRKSKGLKVRQLVDKLNVRQQTISCYEIGKRNIPIGLVEKYADVLGVSIETIIQAFIETKEKKQ